MRRQPVYLNAKLRAVSIANALWQAQYRGPGEANRTFDPWINLGRPSELLDVALAQAKSMAP